MEKHKDDIRIGIIGLGAMGKGLLYQSLITPHIRTVAVCDTDVEKACAILREFGVPYSLVSRQNSPAFATRQGGVAVFEDGNTLAQTDGIDAVYEATGTIQSGGAFAVKALSAGKHLILMNSEIDLIFGSYLDRLAQENGVVSTSCDGDQYGVLKHLIDDMLQWGFTPVMAGNMKGFLDRTANPTSIIAEADKRNLDYKACASYTDGTKINIEMAIVSNAYGFIARVPGMYGPVCDDIDNVQKVFDLETLWQDKRPFVDYVLGAEPGGGVFTIGYCSNPYQRRMLSYYKMGKGPFYTFYRPYHLCHVEALQAAFDAVEGQRAFMRPERGFVTNVYAYAKKDLRPGDELDGIGGYTCYGLIENCADQTDAPGIPICLADRVKVKRNLKKGEKIRLADVQFDTSRPDFQLFTMAGGKL